MERMPEDYESPHYSIQARDYVSIIAVDASGA